jgi:hypothetical protein
MSYPAIRYGRSGDKTTFANDKKYINRRCYDVVVIDVDPDSEIPDKILDLPFCAFDRFYTVDDLNHWVYKLYY